MSVRHFGIYLAYGPTVDLKKEGLGRLLMEFLKAATARGDVRFVVACPYWLKQNLLAFCETEGIPGTSFDVVSTSGVPLTLRLYLAYRARSQAPRKKPWLSTAAEKLRRIVVQHRKALERRAVSTRNPAVLLGLALYALVLGVLLVPLVIVWRALRAIWHMVLRGGNAVRRSRAVQGTLDRLLEFIGQPGDESLDIRLYRVMENAEAEQLLKKINGLDYVEAWYSPSAFWPAFNKIKAPRLMCVPDMFPVDFPVGFSGLEPALLKSFEIVEQSVRGSEHFLTYSSSVKWDTLVDHYAVTPSAVDVVPHACCDLSSWISVRGFPDEEKASQSYCRLLLQAALARTGTSHYIHGLASDSLRFCFYASQFRPNKNLLTLLRAYEYLSRERFLPHKLILTGDPMRFPPVADFIREHNLSRDVLCLHGLTSAELAALYRLADLAVNPSLSEGGCPFTLTEALSVGTPVVMARIPVTEEVVTDPELQEMMLFDPYDWKDAAARIEWALDHREELLPVQQKLYAQLKLRTWGDVVNECLDALARVAGTHERSRAAGR